MLEALLHSSPWLFVGFACCFGALMGSFVNAAVYRLPRDISMWSQKRSFCPRCKTTIAWYDNVPILSFLLLGGRCRACKERIPKRYLAIELIVATLFALSAYQYFVLNRPLPAHEGFLPPTLSTMPWIIMAVQMLLIADLVCLTFTDWESFIIPEQTTLYLLPVGLVLAFCFPELHLSATRWTASPSWNALLDSFQGLVLGAGLLWTVNLMCVIILRKEGMGGGDAHLLGMVGAMLGWKQALETFLIGVFLGTGIGLAMLLWDRIQQARLGDQWQPRKPTFELPEDEPNYGLAPSWPYAVYGCIVLAFEGALFSLSITSGADWYDSRHLSAIVGTVFGCYLLLGALLRKHMIARGTWPMGEIRERADGKKEEVLQGNYIAFGPFLALAALGVLFYDPLIRGLLEWWFTGTFQTFPWAVYWLFHPPPFQMPGI